jgi:hypothetical protein
MDVWEEKIALKGGGTANAQFRFSVSYINYASLEKILEIVFPSSYDIV